VRFICPARFDLDQCGAWLPCQNYGVKTTAGCAVPVDGASIQLAPPRAAFANKRLMREWKTIVAMIGIYCAGQRHGSELCAECQGLLDYVGLRLERCRFGPEKPTCANCPVHCYQRVRRQQIKKVMRYAGPRMVWRYPLLSLRHWLDGYRKAPPITSTASGHSQANG
jgi:Nitrous oxide-stimulated promoter